MTTSPAPASRALPAQLAAATLARAVVNTAHRMLYPFLPEFSRGLGTPLASLTLLLSARSALGMTAPLFGGLPDRAGRRQAMLIGLGVFCAGLFLFSAWPSLPAFCAAVILVVVAKFIFDPALQAYLGDRTPYARRGLVIAITELGWSAAALAGIPLAGLLIGRTDWRGPFLPLGLLGLVCLLALARVIPPDGPPGRRAGSAQAAGQAAALAIWRSPAILGALSLGALMSGANENLNVVYGAWLEQAFGLRVAERGLTLIVIGLAELAGEALVMAWVDRLGKRRAIGLGLVASALAYLALPLAAARLPLALGALFLVFITFEFAVVASIPLMTELAPEARGAVMSANLGAHAAGRMLGALLGARLFRLGFLWNGLAGAAANLIALGLLAWLVRERS